MKRLATQKPVRRGLRKRAAAVEPLAAPIGPEPSGIEAAEQAGPDDARRAASDIERTDEQRPGSIEAVPGAAGIAGFIEAASEDGDDVPRAAPLEDG